MNTTPTPREKYNQQKKEIRELETQNSQLNEEDARVPKNRARIIELEKENMALVTQNPDLHRADMDKIHAAQQKAQMDAITPKPPPQQGTGWT